MRRRAARGLAEAEGAPRPPRARLRSQSGPPPRRRTQREGEGHWPRQRRQTPPRPAAALRARTAGASAKLGGWPSVTELYQALELFRQRRQLVRHHLAHEDLRAPRLAVALLGGQELPEESFSPGRMPVKTMSISSKGRSQGAGQDREPGQGSHGLAHVEDEDLAPQPHGSPPAGPAGSPQGSPQSSDASTGARP